eukprot:4961127-Pyramimonas_sp.AAC.1
MLIRGAEALGMMSWRDPRSSRSNASVDSRCGGLRIGTVARFLIFKRLPSAGAHLSLRIKLCMDL